MLSFWGVCSITYMMNATTNQGDKTMAAHLNTDVLTLNANTALLNLDRTFIGTDDYMGMAYFWDYEYRHDLRDASYARRRKVHTLLLAAGLDVGGESAAHRAIIAGLK